MKMISKLACPVLAIMAILLGATAVKGEALIQFANTANSTISFPGNSQFIFTPATSFQVTSSPFGPWATNLSGGISGVYTIGAITTSGSVSFAPVTGSGGFFITDAAGVKLTGTLVWNSIYTLGQNVGLTYSPPVDLTNLSYAGTNVILQAVAAQGSAVLMLGFVFGNDVPLSALAAGGYATAFTGSISPPPPPAFTAVSLSGANLLVNGSNGIPGTYVLLMSPNLPATTWTPVASNAVTGFGPFSFIATNAVNTNYQQQFYILQAP